LATPVKLVVPAKPTTSAALKKKVFSIFDFLQSELFSGAETSASDAKPA